MHCHCWRSWLRSGSIVLPFTLLLAAGAQAQTRAPSFPVKPIRIIVAEIDKWAKVVKSAGIRAE
jgi:hypothetical protein